MVDAFCSEPHYLAHLAPVWNALPRDERGTFAVPTGDLLAQAAQRYGIDAECEFLSADANLTLVASWRDFQHISESRPLALLEHGAGQTYGGDPSGVANPMYAGGTMRHRVAVFMTPREEVAERNRLAYPKAHHAVVGCPKLDEWILHRRDRQPRELAVVSSHWNGGATVECHSGWWEYRLAVRQMAEVFPTAKHAHPRANAEIRNCDVTVDVPMLDDFDQVLAMAGVYVCDNSSTMYEAAALGIPVVALNPSFYRRNIHHGLRFWDLIPGPEVDSPAHLAFTVAETYRHRDRWGQYARQIAERVYDVLDGSSSERAAAACLERVG